MSKKRQIKETIKTLTIVFLIISAALLMRRTGYYSAIYDKAIDLKNGSKLATEETEPVSSGGATPASWTLSMAVSLDDGTKYAVMYDADAVSETFGMFSAALGEAIGSAGEPLGVTETQWRGSLKGRSVFFQLTYDCPLSLMAAWLGTEAEGTAGNHSVDMISLRCTDSITELFFHCVEENTFYKCETAVSPSTVASKISEFQSNGAYFAYENESLSGLYEYTLLTEELPETPAVSASTPLYSEINTNLLLSALGMNEYVANRYTESDGTEVFVDGDMSLRISTSGDLLFRRGAGGDQQNEQTGLLESIATAYTAVSLSAGQYRGDAEIVFAGTENKDGGKRGIYFDFTVNGIPVEFPGTTHGAEIEIENGVIIKASIKLRNYVMGSDNQNVMPMRLAAAIVASKSSGRLYLVYSDTGDAVNCGWVSD